VRIAKEMSHKRDAMGAGTDFGLVVTAAVEAGREEALDYCRDFFEDFVELAERYVPDIVDEFIQKFPWQHRKWLREGVTVPMGGRPEQRGE